MIEATPWFVLTLCIGATFIWRALGVGVASRIDPNGALFQWFSCVAYAMLAGLITRILVFPVGTLEQTETTDRVIAMAVGFVLFFAFNRNVFVGTIGAFMVFMALAYMRSSGMSF
jgi:branched-subunit amino acid transport protein